MKALRTFWERLPFRHMTVLVVALFVIKEQFPFSNFPMYSRFEPETYYVYVTSEKGDIVPVGPMFGRSISDVKKAYDRKLSNLKKSIKGVRKIDMPADKKKDAAVECLQWLVEITPPANGEKLKALGTIHLHEVQIEYVDRKINKSDTLVGSLPTQSSKLP